MPSRPRTFRASHIPAPRELDRQRGSARERGYTGPWDRAAALFKSEHPLCVGCQAVGWTRPADVVDHIIPHKGNSDLFWDQANWQPCCADHHRIIKTRLEHLFSQGRVERSALKLESSVAQKLTRELLRVGG